MAQILWLALGLEVISPTGDVTHRIAYVSYPEFGALVEPRITRITDPASRYVAVLFV